MPSTFFGLTIASSALTTYQASINTTGNNLSNVQTEGYSRQEAIQKAASALRVYTNYGMAGAGVTTTDIKQIRDEFYDEKYWDNNSNLGEYETKNYYMKQIENYFIDDTSQKGFSTIFSEMYSDLAEVQKDPSSTSARNSFIGSAQTFAEYFNSVSTSLSNVQSDLNQEISLKVNEINSTAQEIASLTKQINLIEISGGYANELRDERALKVDQLSSIVPVDVKEEDVANSNNPGQLTGATTYTISINGQILVDSFNYNTLEVTARDTKVNQSDAEGLYDVGWKDGDSLDLNLSTMTGELKALFDLRDGNDGLNFSGTVSAATASDIATSTPATVTISNPSIEEIEKITMDQTGVLKIGNTTYEYSGFTRAEDASGNVSYTFTLELSETVSAADATAMTSQTASTGESVDYKGIPYYMSQMNEFVRSFSESFNAIHTTGEDLNGDDAGNFFTGIDPVSGAEYNLGTGATDTPYYYLTANNFSVLSALQNDAELMSTASNMTAGAEGTDIVDKLMDLQSDKAQVAFRSGSASEFLQYILSDISIDTQQASTFYSNYSNIESTIENQRLAVSGVDSDEEAMNLVKFQNAYNLASKMVQVLSEMYDRLILETGV